MRPRSDKETLQLLMNEWINFVRKDRGYETISGTRSENADQPTATDNFIHRSLIGRCEILENMAKFKYSIWERTY
jgi:hypothetical protein